MSTRFCYTNSYEIQAKNICRRLAIEADGTAYTVNACVGSMIYFNVIVRVKHLLSSADVLSLHLGEWC